MARYIVGLNQIGHGLLADVTKFSIDIGQGSDPERNLAIYREVVAQIVSLFQLDRVAFLYDIQQLPNWSTIVYIDDRNIDISRQKAAFRDRVLMAAVAIYEELWKHIGSSAPKRNVTYILEQSSATMLMISLYQEPSGEQIELQ